MSLPGLNLNWSFWQCPTAFSALIAYKVISLVDRAVGSVTVSQHTLYQSIHIATVKWNSAVVHFHDLFTHIKELKYIYIYIYICYF